MTGPDHHAEMEEHYATGRDLSEALMRVKELEVENTRLKVDASNHAYRAEIARWIDRSDLSGKAGTEAAMTKLEALRKALGKPGLSGHSGCEGGPYVQLRYDTVAETYRAFEALSRFLHQRAEWSPGSTSAPHPVGTNR